MVATLDDSAIEDEATPSDDEADGTDEEKGTDDLRRTIGLTLLTLGLCLLLFLAYLFSFTTLQQERKQRQMLNVFTTTAGAVTLSGAIPAEGNPLAVLTIPALHLEQVVVQGTSPTDLAAGPGAMPHTALLGTKGNAVIAGRRYTSGSPFANLTTLRRGDRIKVVTGLGVFHYVVITPATIAVPGDVNPASPSKTPELTLLTSSSMTGGSKLYVRAHLASAPAAANRPKVPPSKTELGITGDPSAVGPTILWGILLIAVLALSVVGYQRAKTKIVVVYALSTPIILAVALMFYSHLYQLLPSTL
jgi:LPXTG-site transpeptidase (sortase) family protein